MHDLAGGWSGAAAHPAEGPARAPGRVVWTEGMHLAQHHFQAQGRWFEGLTAFTLSQLFFRPYGLAGCEMDAEALLNGRVAVRHARGIMPDGLAFRFPDDPPPEPLDIRDRFSPVHESRRVLLTIARERPGLPVCAGVEDADTDRGAARYRAELHPLADEATGQDEQLVAVGRKNFLLELEGPAGEEDGSRVSLPLARVRRDGAGHLVYDAAFVPPCLAIGASERLLGLTARLVEMLDAKADALRAQEPQGSAAAPRDAARLWLSHALHSGRAPLHHLHQAREAHPEQLFCELSRLAGALCTFSLAADPRTLPLYDHDAPQRCFDALERLIHECLEVVLPTLHVSVPLEKRGDWYHVGRVADRRCLDRASWYLGVRSTAGAAAVIGEVPRRVKVCSARHVERLVREAFPGLALEHEPAPPAAITPRLGTHYFRIRAQGPCWASIRENGEVGIYTPETIPDAELELVIVTEE
jgi:type VI secretion system protein ImpJ